MNKNTKLFIDTVDRLSASQGFYTQISRDIHNAINNDSRIIDRLDNELPKFNDSVDVILYLEQ